MARYLGSKHRLCRRFGTKLCDSEKCPVIRRPYRPGQHGPKGELHMSEYGTQLAEKQKAKFLYGVLERQFVNYYKKATALAGNSGQNLLSLLERRLDNVMYRSGIMQTRRIARQFVSHGHVLVNGRKTTIPSYQPKKGDVISLSEKASRMIVVTDMKKKPSKRQLPSWLKVESEQIPTVTLLGNPTEEDLALGIDPALIIEFY
ncbi:MAG: 30S ribosomal protein S4, partial [Patescibacteria group bacterium]